MIMRHSKVGERSERVGGSLGRYQFHRNQVWREIGRGINVNRYHIISLG